MLFSQSVENFYDFHFGSYTKSYRGDWTNTGKMVAFSIDSMEIVSDKYPLRISSRRTMGSGGVYDEKREALFSRTIILPRYKYGDICNVKINRKSENLENWKFEVRGLDENEDVLFADSIYIECDSWKTDSIFFPLHHEKALKIVIVFTDDHPKENQNAWIDRVSVSIDGKDVNNMALADFYGGLSKNLDSQHMTPLSFSENNTILKIPEIKDKQIIGLGECTHGSQEVKEACYQFMKTLISEYNCKAVLFERAPDMCLKWDLYVNGMVSGEVEPDIEQETRCYFDDADSFVDFLMWLRHYNETSQSKVRIFGFNTLSQPRLFLFDYFCLLLGEAHSLPYLQLLTTKNYNGVIDLVMTDSRLQSILDTESFDYLLFLLKESARTGTIPSDRNDNREIDMWKRVDKIIQLYLTENSKIVLHAHSSHTNKVSDFFFDVVEKPSMGSYMYSNYGDNYFSIGFQAGEGMYTQDDSGVFSETVRDTLQIPIATSFEYRALKMNSPYFYYPSDELPDDILNIRAIAREKRNLNQFVFCSIKKRFDGLVFIRNNNPLNSIENYPFFYTSGLLQMKNRLQFETLKTIQ